MASLLLATALASGCAGMPGPACGSGQQAVTEMLYFGTDSPDGPVSDAQWQAFVEEVVTPRFPEGMTTWRAQGQWRGADGVIVREASHVLQLVRFGGAGADAGAEIADAYRKRFSQEAVLRIQTQGCASL